MNLLFEIVVTQGFLVDLLGVIGLGLVALAAIRISRQMSTDTARLMTWGAMALMAGRLGFLFFGYWLSNHPAPLEIDYGLIQTVKSVNIGLLTGGLASVVWGFWRHEQQVSEELAA